jgi:cytochrome c oxidase assembly factor 4
MNADPHGRQKQLVAQTNDGEGDDDPVERMLKKSGCLELHYRVQECMADHKDWRRCQPHVQAFKKCIDADAERRRGSSAAN